MEHGNCVISQINKHVSIRKYQDKEIPSEHLEKILDAARRAPTAWNLMPVHISAVTDPHLKSRAADAVGGQEHVARAAVFLVFSVDYGKVLEASRKAGVEPAPLGFAHFAAALIDAGIMAGWAGLAAESLGYGVTYIAVYSNPCGVSEALGLPEELVPVVGITVGVPAENPSIRPRQPPVSVYSLDSNVPPAKARAEGVLKIYSGKEQRFFRAVVAPGGYLDRLSTSIVECLRKKGYRV